MDKAEHGERCIEVLTESNTQLEVSCKDIEEAMLSMTKDVEGRMSRYGAEIHMHEAKVKAEADEQFKHLREQVCSTAKHALTRRVVIDRNKVRDELRTFLCIV